MTIEKFMGRRDVYNEFANRQGELVFGLTIRICSSANRQNFNILLFPLELITAMYLAFNIREFVIFTSCTFYVSRFAPRKNFTLYFQADATFFPDSRDFEHEAQ